MLSYDNKKFRTAANSENGEVSGETIFQYSQSGNIVSANYSGGAILEGHLLGLCDEACGLDFSYHHINLDGKLMTGVCRSVPDFLPDGRVRLFEKWRWTCGDFSEGESVLEEV